MTERTLPFTRQNFLPENLDGVKITMLVPLIDKICLIWWYYSYKIHLLFWSLLMIWELETFLSLTRNFNLWQHVYELVVRHFLACVSQPAIGAETTVEIDIAGEQFSASGRVIIAVSFLLLMFFCSAICSGCNIHWLYLAYTMNMLIPHYSSIIWTCNILHHVKETVLW